MSHTRAVAIIRERLNERGMPDAELARQIHVSRQFLGQLLRGQRVFNHGLIDRIAGALDLDPDRLYAEAGIVPPALAKDLTRSAAHIKAARFALKLHSQENIR